MTSIYHKCNWPVSWQATQTTVGAAHKSPPSCSYELPTNVAITPALQVATCLRAAKALNGVCWCRARWIKRKRALLAEGETGAGLLLLHSWGKKPPLFCCRGTHHHGKHMTDAFHSWENRRFSKTSGVSGASEGVAM